MVPEISISATSIFIGNSDEGSGVSEKPKLSRKSMKQNWKFLVMGRFFKKKKKPERGMDIFWNQTSINVRIFLEKK